MDLVLKGRKGSRNRRNACFVPLCVQRWAWNGTGPVFLQEESQVGSLPELGAGAGAVQVSGEKELLFRVTILLSLFGSCTSKSPLGTSKAAISTPVFVMHARGHLYHNTLGEHRTPVVWGC